MGGGGDDNDEHCSQPHCTADIPVPLLTAGSGRTGSGFHITCCGWRLDGTTTSGLTSTAMGRLMTAFVAVVAAVVTVVSSDGGGGANCWTGGEGMDDDVDDPRTGLTNGIGGRSACWSHSTQFTGHPPPSLAVAVAAAAVIIGHAVASDIAREYSELPYRACNARSWTALPAASIRPPPTAERSWAICW